MKLSLKKSFDIVRYSPTIEEGLNKEQLDERINHKLYNVTKQKGNKSYFRICCGNIFTFFNFIWILIFSALMAVQSYSDLLFIVVIFLNTLISIIQECRAKATVEKLAMTTMPRVKVVRDSTILEVMAGNIVLDDVIKLEIGNSIPADCIIMDGKIEVNESLLTGESDAIKKNIGDKLFSGSFIISGACTAKVDKVGKDSYIQSVASQAKKFKSPNSNLNKDLNTIIKYIGIGIIPVGVIMFINNYYSYGSSMKYAITKTCGALTGMVPAGMFLLITIALAVGVVKLSKKKTLVQDLFSIEMLARTNVLCLDKTGTITDGTMQVKELIDLKYYKRNTNEKVIANILYEQKTNNSTSNALLMQFSKQNDWKMKYNLEFSSKRKCTATSFEGKGTFVIGAPEFTGCKLDKKLQDLIFEHSESGKRVLLLVHSDKMLDEKEIIPTDSEPLALITIEDHIREDAYDTIEWFKQNGVQIKIISGDNPITVSNIARRVGVENADACISLEGMSLVEVEKIATKFTVFGRVSPEQKHTIIKALKKNGDTVAMTGDGVNDTLALKEADCSIAMADGSEVARNLSNLVLMDSKFSSLPAVVKEGRQVINNVQQSSTLYLMKTLFTILLSLFSIVTLSGYPFTPVQLFILELFVIGMPSVILALQPNSSLIKGDFIPVVLKRSIPSGLLMFLNVFAVIILMRFGILDAEEFSSLSTLTLILTGYINLFFLCLPLNKLRIGCLSLSAFCIILAISVMGDFFGITSFSLKVIIMLLVFAVVSIPLHILIPKVVKKIEMIYLKRQQEVLANKILKEQKQRERQKMKYVNITNKYAQKMSTNSKIKNNLNKKESQQDEFKTEDILESDKMIETKSLGDNLVEDVEIKQTTKQLKKSKTKNNKKTEI